MRAARRRDGERGAATTEALIILPFFFIVWGALFFSPRLSEKRVVVNENARTCAWARMTAGCGDNDVVMPRCSHTRDDYALVNEDLEGSRASLINYDERIGKDKPRGFAWPFSERFGPYFRPIIGAERQTQVNKPKQIGGGEFGVKTQFSEMCNENPADETVPIVSNEIFCDISGWCG